MIFAAVKMLVNFVIFIRKNFLMNDLFDLVQYAVPDDWTWISYRITEHYLNVKKNTTHQYSHIPLNNSHMISFAYFLRYKIATVLYVLSSPRNHRDSPSTE